MVEDAAGEWESMAAAGEGAEAGVGEDLEDVGVAAELVSGALAGGEVGADEAEEGLVEGEGDGDGALVAEPPAHQAQTHAAHPDVCHVRGHGPSGPYRREQAHHLLARHHEVAAAAVRSLPRRR